MKYVFCMFFAATAACGGQVAGGLPDAGGGNDGGGQPSAICPVSVPTENSSCSHEGAECEYGTNTDYLCNTIAMCQGGQWLYSKGTGAMCSTGLGPDCPAQSSLVDVGGACSPYGERCNYPDYVCECSYPAGPPTANPEWECENPAQGCPIPRPRLGSACNAPASLSCDYGSCTVSGGVRLSCQAGAWVRESVACPL